MVFVVSLSMCVRVYLDVLYNVFGRNPQIIAAMKRKAIKF